MKKEKIKEYHCLESEHATKEEEELHEYNMNCACNPIWEKENKSKFLSGMVDHKIILHRIILNNKKRLN